MEPPLQQTSWHGYMPTETENYTPHIQGYYTQTYDPEPARSSAYYSMTSFAYPGFRETAPTWMAPPMNPFEGFTHDEATFGTGFIPSEAAEDYYEYPQLMADSPLNPQ